MSSLGCKSFRAGRFDGAHSVFKRVLVLLVRPAGPVLVRHCCAGCRSIRTRGGRSSEGSGRTGTRTGGLFLLCAAWLVSSTDEGKKR